MEKLVFDIFSTGDDFQIQLVFAGKAAEKVLSGEVTYNNLTGEDLPAVRNVLS